MRIGQRGLVLAPSARARSPAAAFARHEAEAEGLAEDLDAHRDVALPRERAEAHESGAHGVGQGPRHHRVAVRVASEDWRASRPSNQRPHLAPARPVRRDLNCVRGHKGNSAARARGRSLCGHSAEQTRPPEIDLQPSEFDEAL